MKIGYSLFENICYNNKRIGVWLSLVRAHGWGP